MEEATIALEAELTAGVWTDIMADVFLGVAPLHFKYGIRGTKPMDLVASTGILRCILDNGLSNSAKERGYYTPEHADARAGFDDGMRIRPKITYGGTPYYKFVGYLSSLKASPGLFREQNVALQAVDWMAQAAAQKISQIAIQRSKRIDQLIPYVLADMPIAPRATSYATGVETFATWFNTDIDESMSPMSVFQKMARNEYGPIYLKGDTAGGETLRFDSRHTRALNQTSILTLDETMDELEISYGREDVFNLVKTRIYPLKVDAAATTVLYELQKSFSIAPGQSITLDLPYKDPTTSRRVSATEVVDPLVADTGFKFGSTTPSTNDLNSSLGIVLVVGGNTTKATLTNNASITGWVNLLKLLGKGIYPYDPQTLESKDQTSIDKRGELTLPIDLEQVDSPVLGQAYADYHKNRNYLPQKLSKKVRFLANQSAAHMAAALQGEPSSRFTLKERMTAIDSDYFINGIDFDIEAGGKIWCTWIGVPADTVQLGIFDTSRIEVDAYMAF